MRKQIRIKHDNFNYEEEKITCISDGLVQQP